MDIVNKALVENVFSKFPNTGQNKSELLDCLKIVRSIPLYNCLEIGTQFGGTFYLWQQICKGKVISIDLPMGPFGGIDYDFFNKRNNELRNESSFFISGDSKSEDVKSNFISILNNEKLDLLFIDGDHSYNGVKHDYEFYSQFVIDGGFIIFHDVGDNIMNTTTECECKRFFDSIVDKEKVLIDHQTSWTSSIDRIGGIGIIKK